MSITPGAASQLYNAADFSQGAAYIAGEYLPLKNASIPMTDRGFVRSDATYDVVHVWNGRFFRLDDYIDRFYHSMAGFRMSIKESKDELKAILFECVRRSGLRNAYVQMTCTRGVPKPGSRDPRECINQLTCFAQPFVWIANEQQRQEGLSMIISSTQRIPPEAVDPRLKNFHWLDLTMAVFEAYDKSAIVPVLPDRDGNITEGPGFNIFSVKNSRIVTPGRGVFEGMTRRTVIELAPELQIACEVRPLKAAELRASDEIFITSTAGGIMPVTRLDGREIGDGRPGRIARAIHDLYWRRHEEGWKATEIDYGAAS